MTLEEAAKALREARAEHARLKALSAEASKTAQDLYDEVYRAESYMFDCHKQLSEVALQRDEVSA